MAVATDAGSYANYWDKVVELLGGVNPKRKTTAINGFAASKFAEEGEVNVRELWLAMGGSRWTRPKSTSVKNWSWRNENMKEGVTSKEVALERKVFDLGGPDRWTYQMPTSSGVEGPSVGKRRSIDLVHKADQGQYTLIELKCDSDNPLYASFEILGYGLAYLHARRHLTVRDEAAHEILFAERIDLLVLGPLDWYHYTNRSGMRTPYPLAALERAITAGLAALRSLEPAMPSLGMGFQFSAYASNPDDTARAAREIVDMFEGRAPWITPIECEALPSHREEH